MKIREFAQQYSVPQKKLTTEFRRKYPDQKWTLDSEIPQEFLSELEAMGNQQALSQGNNSLQEQSVHSETQSVEFQNKPVEQPAQPQEQSAQLQQLPQGQTTQLGELAQALQFVLAQQVSPSYSDGLKTEAATKEGAAIAYREFLAFQQGYSSTSESLHQLNQALDVTRYQRASGQLDEVQRDFLSGLQRNSQDLQTQQQNHQSLIESVKSQSQQELETFNNAILGAIQDLNSKNF